jgi:probable rRNA maturation factor
MPDRGRRIDVTVIDKAPVPDAITEAHVTELVHHCLREERATGDWQVAIAFVGTDEISMLHEQFMGDPAPTDIITFPYDDPEIAGGDIAICVPVAAEYAGDHGSTSSAELEFLVLHGLLHLLEYDDASDDERTKMLRRQQEILDSWPGASR